MTPRATTGPHPGDGVDGSDRAAVAAQLGRVPRAMRAVAHRCRCGLPDVVETAPRLADGTPFPTLYYLTCPRAVAAVGRLEASGMMREMTDRLRADAQLAAGYRAAHEAYLRRRDQLGRVPEVAGISAGGMPTRVKCLHVLVGHALAAGPGVNPLGDEALAALPPWWAQGRCVPPAEPLEPPPAGGSARGGEAGRVADGRGGSASGVVSSSAGPVGGSARAGDRRVADGARSAGRAEPPAGGRNGER